MKISLITPAIPHSRSGNRVTAIRWKNIFQDLQHQVKVTTEYDGKPCDVMIALHAWRSAKAIKNFRNKYPDNPLIVALTGTDIYKFIHTHRKVTLQSIKSADALVVLHDLAHLAIPASQRKKVSVIYQSAKPFNKSAYKTTKSKVKSSTRYFDLCVVGHLRDEKDPLRAAYAVRDLPNTSRIRIKQFGKVHSPVWSKLAKQEMKSNKRYQWFGEVKHWQIRKQYRQAKAIILSSKMEGGANVISEACVAGLPVIASDIAGSVGLLGVDYPAYFKVGDTKSLQSLLLKVEEDAKFLHTIQKICKTKAKLFTYEKERANWHKLLKKYS